MSCCSGRRLMSSPTPTIRAAQNINPADPPVEAASDQTLAYTGRATLVLRGPFSGRIYHVGPDLHQVSADSRDVDALLRTGQFSG